MSYEVLAEDDLEDEDDGTAELDEELARLKEDEFPCGSCLSNSINGTNTHEHGCPARSRIVSLERSIESYS